MIDLSLGYRGVPGMWSVEDANVVQLAVRRATFGTSVVEMGAWCGRSLASICDVLHAQIPVYSYDNYADDSQAVGHAAEGNDEGDSPIPAAVAKRLRNVVAKHYEKLGLEVHAEVCEASEAGKLYKGPQVSVLLIDDHHSAEQLQANFDTWLPHAADRCTILLHDYLHLPYGLMPVAEKVLVGELKFDYVGWRPGSGLGIFARGF